MRIIYFIISILGLLATTYSLTTTPAFTDFNEMIITSLQIILLVISIVGVVMHYEYFSKHVFFSNRRRV